MRKQMPRPGREVYTPDGSGTVLENNVITERTRVKVVLDDGTFDVREYPFRELRLKSSPSSMKISEEDASFTQEEDPALLSLEDGASSSIPEGENALSEQKKPPRKQQKRRPPSSEQPKEGGVPLAAETASPAETARTPGRRRGSRGGRKRNKGNKQPAQANSNENSLE